MLIPNQTVVAVADGEKLNMFRNSGDEREIKLVALDDVDIEAAAGSASVGRTSSANPDGGQSEEAVLPLGSRRCSIAAC
ncbi:MAG: hypothetical protein JWQ51_491 [Tardiphaga sp.]|nr:hypothetical protein [Tardiphaga sp.]